MEVNDSLIEGSSEDEITTGVDDLLEILKKTDRMALSDAAKELGVGLDVVQSWVDFLVEEKIVGIEYKFTKPFIYLNKKPGADKAEKKEEPQSFESIKKDFVDKAMSKDIPDSNIHSLWKNHVMQALDNKKLFFMQEASKRGLGNLDQLWEQYKQKVADI